ncbi:MAG: M14 family metallopeptidase [Rhodospirillaceae bacterium]|nr:M14 family metallopeptidase [Rhodospirillaceae bacterium]
MTLDDFFSPDYATARRKFLSAAAEAGLAVVTHTHPLTGPHGETLALDLVALCPDKAAPCRAERVFVAMSATHGVEGFVGAAAQTAWLKRGHWQRVPKGMGVLLLHAVNPHGFAHLRRVTEDNVDLNRNFADFTKPLPRKPAYDDLAEAICPKDWTDAALTAAEEKLSAFAQQHGQRALHRAIMGGQYTHPTGVFYGGTKPTWSRETIMKILSAYCAEAKHVALLDFHTGLGDFGAGVNYCVGEEGSAGVVRAHEVWGDDVTILASTPGSGGHDGYNLTGIARLMADKAVYGNTLEFGTYPTPVMIRALRADNWLHLHGDLNSDQGRAIKAEIKRVFYPETSEDWKARTLARCLSVWERGLQGLARL